MSDLHHELGRLIEWCDREVDDIVRGTLGRLPADVLEFALEKCAFASVGSEVPAQVIRPTDRWLVLLSEYGYEGQPAVSETVVAHEIAHAWLGHEESDDDKEREVRALVRSWGFTGHGADEGSNRPTL